MTSNEPFIHDSEAGADASIPAESATIYPHVADEGNRRLLREWLTDHDVYGVVDENTPLADARADLCIVDEDGLRQHAEELQRAKSEAEPVLLPVLLLLSDRRSEVIETDRGEIADNVFSTTVDEIVSLPIRQMELEWRIRALLRLREQSLELHSQAAALRRFQEAVEASGHAVYITDAEGTIEYVNPAFEEITGYSEDEAVGETPGFLNSGEMSPEYFRTLWETVGSGDVWDERIVNRRKDGETYTASQTIAPITEDGEIRAFVAVQRDVTERDRLQRELEQYREIVERVDDPIMLQDREGNFQLCNRAVTEFAGRSREALLGEDEFSFMDEETARTIEEKKEDVLETERPVHYEVSPTFERTAHDRVTFSTWRYPYYDSDGDLVGTIAICRDVTELKRRETTLQWYERAITGSTDLIAAIDEDERYLFANPQYRTHHGIEDEDVTQLTLAAVLSEEEYRNAKPHVRRVFDGETIEYRTRRTHPMRGERIFDVRYYPIDAGGETVGVAVFRDVTEIEQRTQHLQVVDHILRHNLRNSLTVIRSEATKLREQASDGASDGATDGSSESAERIVEQADELLTTSEKSRDITGILATEPEQRRLDVADVARAVADSIDSAYPNAVITVNAPPRAVAFATPEIEEAITELVRNAIVHNEGDEPAAEISVRRDGDDVRVDIVDDGDGLPEMERSVLETGEAVDPLFHGTGLGLWLVFWILKRSGGSVDVEDAPEGGTKVTLVLPQRRSE